MNKKDLRIKILQGKDLAKKLNDLSKNDDTPKSYELSQKKKLIDKRVKFYEEYLKEILR